MKCFEIDTIYSKKMFEIAINRKHEMFWNKVSSSLIAICVRINRKHEMFWNCSWFKVRIPFSTINRKHEMFWNSKVDTVAMSVKLTVNMKCFEMLELMYFGLYQHH